MNIGLALIVGFRAELRSKGCDRAGGRAGGWDLRRAARGARKLRLRPAGNLYINSRQPWEAIMAKVVKDGGQQECSDGKAAAALAQGHPKSGAVATAWGQTDQSTAGQKLTGR